MEIHQHLSAREFSGRVHAPCYRRWGCAWRNTPCCQGRAVLAGHGGGPPLGCCCSRRTQKDAILQLLLSCPSSRVLPKQPWGLPFESQQLCSTCCLGVLREQREVLHGGPAASTGTPGLGEPSEGAAEAGWRSKHGACSGGRTMKPSLRNSLAHRDRRRSVLKLLPGASLSDSKAVWRSDWRSSRCSWRESGDAGEAHASRFSQDKLKF